jgi:hypothetical protein
MRDQPISCIGDARLRGGDAAAGIEHATLGVKSACKFGSDAILAAPIVLRRSIRLEADRFFRGRTFDV